MCWIGTDTECGHVTTNGGQWAEASGGEAGAETEAQCGKQDTELSTIGRPQAERVSLAIVDNSQNPYHVYRTYDEKPPPCIIRGRKYNVLQCHVLACGSSVVSADRAARQVANARARVGRGSGGRGVGPFLPLDDLVWVFPFFPSFRQVVSSLPRPSRLPIQPLSGPR